MSTTFPTTIQTMSNPTASDLLENAVTALDHDFQHTTVNDTLFAIQTKMGVTGSAVTTTFDYKLSGVVGTDKAVSKTGIETLSNKTLTAPQINMGSDATGDMYYRNGSGVFTRLPAGADGTIISYASGIPTAIPNPSAADGSTTVKGVFEAATAAEINAGTATGSTGAKLAVTPDQLLASNFITNASLKFGGTGADGALTVSSGTTNIDLGGAQVVIKNYTSISITGTGSVTFSNPHASGTFIILKSVGAVTLTSSTIPNLDASGMGAAGGTGGTGGSTSNAGSAGTTAIGIFDDSSHAGGAGVAHASGGTGGPAGAIYNAGTLHFYTRASYQLARSIKGFCPGSGGGGGAGNYANNARNGGNGGNGGGGLLIQCGGALNFTSALGISVAGKNGSNGVTDSGGSNNGRGGSGGGGGGAGGFCIVLYNTLTAASGTINTAGGTGGTGGDATSDGTGGGGGQQNSGAGGGGAGSDGGAGGIGGAHVTTQNNGNAGAAAAGRRGGGGGGSGASRTYNSAGTSTGAAGGAGGASENVLIAANNDFA